MQIHSCQRSPPPSAVRYTELCRVRSGLAFRGRSPAVATADCQACRGQGRQHGCARCCRGDQKPGGQKVSGLCSQVVQLQVSKLDLGRDVSFASLLQLLRCLCALIKNCPTESTHEVTRTMAISLGVMVAAAATMGAQHIHIPSEDEGGANQWVKH